MTGRDDDLRIKPGRIRDRGPYGRKAQSFVGQVMRATKKAGHTGYRFNGASRTGSGSTFGRGRFAATARSLSRTQRRVIVKARVVRHRGARYRSAPLAKHISYLKRDGVTRDGRDATMFDRDGNADERAFAERCEDDRHHFRFIVSPEDAGSMEDLHAFTRDLMDRAERDLGTDLDWVAVDHWNTDNPHVHVLLRGKTDHGKDLVISRDYIARGFRARAEELVGLELGPRTQHEIAASLDTEIDAEHWTGLDRVLRALADESGGIVDLRPGAPEPSDPELRRRLIGRAQTLERLGLADRLAPAVWELKPGMERTLRELGDRGDIIKTMHRALADGPARSFSDFAVESTPAEPVLGRLVDRGLHDELTGEAYAVIDGVDGRVHHLRFPDLARTGDTPIGGIVETRSWTPRDGSTARLSLVGRSDLSLAAQVDADGATWLDRLQLAKGGAPLSGNGFGSEVHDALGRRAEHLVTEGLATRQGPRVKFARDLLATLRKRELDTAATKLTAETGLPRRITSEGEAVIGTYRQRLDLASGRFAMIDDGMGFELVPWKPQLEKHLGQTVTGTMTPGGGVDWTLGRRRSLGI
ncbi:DUF3363 domain-containing protein [Pacificimonas sp. WHA3]|uniref:DUF3363 domain-containing protein n=1 Tax=Pacificimonas pallii TaxID=2827236 RepID=A0ABS6SBU2_9SPHN|nr:DUF3363 domain-containing protein [Pacificimonas pallii]MBV7255892.1 DUF3363 domain-containing protein [Pacificimonas pallii]